VAGVEEAPSDGTVVPATPGPFRPVPGPAAGAGVGRAHSAESRAVRAVDAAAVLAGDGEAAHAHGSVASGDSIGDRPAHGERQASLGSAGPSGSSFQDRALAAEALPLADRAEAFAVLHDDLRTRLEGGGDTSA
jgi:hypothetical protein